MALTVDEIAEILNTMRVENEHNVENFEKVLTGINNKLELMAEDNEATDLIKLYLSELKKIVEEKHNNANDRFRTLENSLNNLLSSQEQFAKTSELRDLFHVLSASFDTFSGEFTSQTSTLETVNDKLAQIEESVFDKGELASLLNGFASDLSEMNSGIDNSFKNIETSLSDAVFAINRLNALDSRISSLSEDINAIPSKISFAGVEERIENFQNIINSIREAVSEIPALNAGMLSSRFTDIENSFKNIVTEQNFLDFKENLADFVRQISDNAVSISEGINANRQRIENILASINTLDYKNDFNAVSEKISALEDAVKGISQSSVYEIQNLGRTLSSVVTDSDFAGFKAELADFVQKIIDNSSALNSELSYSTERIENILSTVNSLDYTNDFENISKEISELKSALSDNLSLSESVNSLIGSAKSEITQKLDGFETSLSTIVTDSDFAGFKAELADFVQKIIDNSSALNSELSYSTERIENILTTIKSLDFRDDFAAIESRINDLKETFDAGSKINYTNLSEQIFSIKESMESSFTQIDSERDAVYSDFKTQLTGIFDNLDNLIKSNPQKSIDELSSLVLSLSETASVLRNGITEDIQGDYGDLKSSINAVAENLQIVKADLIAKNSDLYNLSSQNSNLLEGKIDLQIKTLEDLKTEFSDAGRFDLEKITASVESLYADISGIIADLKEDANTNYEAVKSYVEELSSALSGIKDEICNLSGQNSNILSGKMDSLSDGVNEFHEEFKQACASDAVNFSTISGGINEVSEKIDGLQSSLARDNDLNMQTLKSLMDELCVKLSSDLDIQKEIFSHSLQGDEQKRLVQLQNIAGDVKNLESLIAEGNETYKNTIEENIKSIREYIAELSNSVYESRMDSDDKFSTKLEALDALNHGFENFVVSVNNQIRNVLDTIISLDVSGQNSVIQNEVNNIKVLCETISASLNESQKRKDELTQIISSLMDSVLKKEDINEISFKLDEYTDILNSLKDFIEASFASNSSDINLLFEKLETSFANISSKQDFLEFKSELSGFLQTITDNANILNVDSTFNKEKIQEISEKVSTLEIPDYSYDLVQISSKIDDLQELFANSSASNYEGISAKLDDISSKIEENGKDEKITGKLDEFSELINSLKNIVSASIDTSSTEEQFLRIEDAFSRIVTEEDFTNFRIDFGDFIQKILDNADVIHLNSEANKEQINKIVEKLAELDYTQNFDSIEGKLTEIQTSFENNSKTNYENIINEIQDFRSNLAEKFSDTAAKENFDRLNLSLAELSDNVQILSDISSHKSIELLDKIAGQIQSSANEITDNVNSGIKINIDDLKISLANAINELNTVKNDFTEKSDNVTFSVTSGYDNLKSSIENILSAFNSLNDYLKDDYTKSTHLILSEIEELSAKAGELKDEINKFTSDYIERVYNISEEISDKLEGLSVGLSGSLTAEVSEFKNILSSVSDNLHNMYGELKDSNELQVNELNGISGNISEFRGHVDEIIQNLKDYITELNVASKSSKSLSDSKFSEKLLSLESAVVNSADAYETKIELLQNKIAEFVQIVENSSSDTEAKISSSAQEINYIKDELTSVSELINAVKLSSDEKTSQIISLLDTRLDSITVSVNEIADNALKGINSSISDNLLSVDDKLTVLQNTIDLLRGTNLSEFANNIDDKIVEIKQELGLVNADIADALQNKSEDILRALEPVKTAIDEFAGYDFEKLLTDIKSELETSFMNFSVDVNGELSANSESVLRLEQAYKETFNKISVIEDCVSEDIQNSIELLNVTIETNTRNLKCGFEEKLDEYINDLRVHLDEVLHDTRTLDSIENLKDEISVKLDSVLSEQSSIAEQADIISAGISTLGDDIKNYVQSACENTIDKYSPIQSKEAIEALHQKIDTFVDSTNNEDILEALLEIEQKSGKLGADISETVHEIMDKIETFEKDNSLILAFHELAAEIDSFKDNSELNTALQALSEKIDILAADESISEIRDDISEAFDSVNSKIDVLVADTNVEDLKGQLKDAFDSLNDKIDIIASDAETADLKDELHGAFESLNTKIDIIATDTAVDDLKDELRGAFESLNSKIDIIAADATVDDLKYELNGAFESLNTKIDIIAADTSVDDLKDELNTVFETLNNKIDIIASDNAVDDVKDELNDVFNALNAKIDIIVSDTTVEDLNEQLNDALETVNSKIDILASDTSIEELHEKLDEVHQTEDRVSEMLSTLHEKVDAIASDGSDFNIEDEIDDIKSLIFEQRKYFEASSDEKAAAIDKYLRDVLLKLDNVDLEKNSEDIKDSITNALVSLFEQVSFVEESEDIKDFVEEKTDAINQSLLEVQNQLKQIASSNDEYNYSYTLQDVETDIAKLRMAINNMSGNDFASFSDDIKKIVSSVEGLESSLTQDQMVDLKGDIEKLNDDILSISSRTNKLLLTSDESYKALNDGLNNFSSLVYKLEDRINYLDNTEASQRLERKIDNIHSMAVASANADKVFHQVMMYLGEWIDSTTENIASITDKTSEISKIKKNLAELKEAIPEKTEILDEIENKFEEQELRIDRLEMKLEKILSALEEKDDMMLNRKVDKIEKLISRLGTNIEKLTSYVDEE